MMRFYVALLAVLMGISSMAQSDFWTRKNGPLGGEIYDIEHDPASGKIFVLAGANFTYYPYVSSDNGATWSKVNYPGFEYGGFEDIEIANNTVFLLTDFRLYASTDEGVTFTIRNDTQLSSASKLKRLSNGNLVILGWGNIFYSSNNGFNWNTGYSNAQISRLFLAVNSSDQLFILVGGRPYRSVDGGISFTEQSSGIPAGSVYSLTSDKTGTQIYCVNGTNIYSSTDGTSWTSIKGGSISDATIADGSTSTPSFLEFSEDGLGMYFIDNTNHKLHAKTINGAASAWTLRASAFPSATRQITAAEVLDFPGSSPATSTGYFGSRMNLLKTTTGGASVVVTNTGIAEQNATQLEIDGFENLYMVADYSGILRSTDFGNSWNAVSAVPAPVNIFTVNPSGTALYALTGGIIYRSTDKGINWPTVTTPVPFGWIAAADDNKIFGMYNNRDIYYSANQGGAWTGPVVISGLPGGSGYYISSEYIFIASNSLIFLRVEDLNNSTTDFYKIDITYNGSNAITSATATKITNLPFANFSKFYAMNGKFYVYNYSLSPNKLAVSDNGGTSWTTRNVPSGNDLYFADNGYLFLSKTGSSNQVLISRDDGETFQTTSFAYEDPNLNALRDVAIDQNGYAYLAFSGDYLFQSASTIVTPDSPSGLVAMGVSSTAIALQWQDNSDNEKYFRIEQSVNGVTFTKVGELDRFDICTNNIASYVVKGLTEDTEYTFRITAVNDAGSSSPISASFATTVSCAETIPDNRSWDVVNSGESGLPVVGAPVVVNIRSEGNGLYRISDASLGLLEGEGYDEVVPAYFYEACGTTFLSKASGNDQLIANGDGAWNSVAGTLTLKWRTCDADHTETLTLTLRTSDPAPEAPGNVRALVISNTEIEVNWSSTDFASSYSIERSLSSGSGYAEVGTVNYPATSFTDAGPFTSETEYHYRVKAVNGNTVPLSSPYSTVSSIIFQTPNFLVANTILSDLVAPTIGAYWADFNSDGFDDFLTMKFDVESETTQPVFFRNEGNGTFQKFEIQQSADYLFGSVIDYNSDGFPDLVFIGNEDGTVDFFRGNGNFTFTPVDPGELGDLAGISPGEQSAPSWGDINNDGLPDVLVNVSNGGPNQIHLYKQNPDHSFTKIPGGDFATDPDRMSAGLWADYDNDGDQDVLLANSNGPLRLYKNNGDDTFTKMTGIGIDAENAFGASWGDFNNDGFIDFYSPNNGQHALYKNNGDGTFTKDVSTSISQAGMVLNSSWGDFNNDGFLDLITGSFSSPTNLFIRNPNNHSFQKISTEKIADPIIAHYGTASSDYDHNGFLDIGFSNLVFDDATDDVAATPNHLFRNNNSTGNWIAIKLVPNNGSELPIGAKVRLLSQSKIMTREIQSQSSFVSRNSNLLHFGLGSATQVEEIQIRWPSGIVQKLTNVSANQILIIPEDGTAPALTAFTPTHESTDVAVDIDLTLTYNDEPIAVAGKKITITGGSSPIELDASEGVIVENTLAGNWEVRFDLPELQSLTTYSVSVDQGLFIDLYGNQTLPVVNANWSFTTMDAIPPTITPFTQVPTLDQGFSSALFSIRAMDNSSSVNVKLFFRGISGSTYSQLSGVAASGDPANFQFTVNESIFDATGLEYYFIATDPSGNESRDPADGAYKTFLKYTSEVAIPSVRLGIGGTKTSWRIFAIPFELDNNNIASIFDEFAELELKTDWRLIRYQHPNFWQEYNTTLTTIDRGKGYFINIKSVANPVVEIGSDLSAPANSRDNLFQMNLVAGWNMIGNPYLTTIDWANVAALNGLTGQEATLVKFNGNYTSTSSTLSPFEGGFVFMQSAKTVAIPFQGQTSSDGRIGIESLPADLSGDEWMVPLTLTQGELTNEFGGFGMAREADRSFDRFDYITLPRFFDYAEINFKHPEFFAPNFSRDVVPPADAYTWSFEVESNQHGAATLTWDNSAFGNGDQELFLVDEETTEAINMREYRSYTFDPSNGRKFEIHFGNGLASRLNASRVVLGNIWPNPASDYELITVPFILPAKDAQYHVKLEVFDMMGKKVATLVDGLMTPDHYAIGWHPRAQGLGSGLYTYRLSVTGSNIREIRSGKVMLK